MGLCILIISNFSEGGIMADLRSLDESAMSADKSALSADRSALSADSSAYSFDSSLIIMEDIDTSDGSVEVLKILKKPASGTPMDVSVLSERSLCSTIDLDSTNDSVVIIAEFKAKKNG
jgi:hypothetical protein